MISENTLTVRLDCSKIVNIKTGENPKRIDGKMITLYTTDELNESIYTTTPNADEFIDVEEWQEWTLDEESMIAYEERTETRDGKHHWFLQIAKVAKISDTEYKLFSFSSYKTHHSDRWNNPEWVNQKIEEYKNPD